MTYLNQLQQDHAAITNILQSRRGVTMETLPTGVQISLKMYFMILEDALKTLNSLIHFLKNEPHERPSE